AFWLGLLAALVRVERAMLVSLENGRPGGTVQLLLAMPDNGRHRAEVVKLKVHPQARRQGIALLLMQEVQALAAR
ncbi:GNAT family N-acetyltransferase, partial [Serratia bockelmannii]|uniref:GNAT family N-acetyltransferase n=1 Tax=Serratia bockelmannii TaxID=2703793 RepID=UPI003CED381F